MVITSIALNSEAFSWNWQLLSINSTDTLRIFCWIRWFIIDSTKRSEQTSDKQSPNVMATPLLGLIRVLKIVIWFRNTKNILKFTAEIGILGWLWIRHSYSKLTWYHHSIQRLVDLDSIAFCIAVHPVWCSNIGKIRPIHINCHWKWTNKQMNECEYGGAGLAVCNYT